ncbi:helix-turn-helix transcriptional regulator [Amaricoccus sp.]|uniref:helix-turn-helix domain-containing protein n=1 Tax=Amaricoccus sp. TaxID=1872485 RepID=UPI001B69CA26|nr:helix-turn-helix transcriptional regulator [Amaricoccus sp.]MBP7242930.1 helix-turn-helix transcriptional regulator [Amaricoccus sp.]
MTDSIGTRLRSERRRLGLGQEAFGALGGVGRASQVGYEADRRAPGADYLAGIAAHGVDVLYVVTGRRTPVATVAPGAPAAARPPVEPMSPDELWRFFAAAADEHARSWGRLSDLADEIGQYLGVTYGGRP